MTSFEDVIYSEVNGPVTSYIVIATYLDEDGNTMLYFHDPEDQAINLTLGLIEFAKMYITKKFTQNLDM